METRSCSNMHFIQAIRSEMVMKIRNVDSHGKPSFVFKSLKDIYEAEDARSCGSSTSSSWGKCGDSLFDKCESSHSFVVDRRTLQEKIKPETDRLVPSGYDDETSSDLDDNTTLKQLRKRFKTKKRKLESSTDVNPNQAVKTKQLKEEGSDLYEPLISWKSKLPKKLKTKKKCVKRSIVASSEISLSIKYEPNLDSPASEQALCDLPLPLHVKLEVPEPKLTGLQSATFSHELFIRHNEDPIPGTAASNETLETVEHGNCELRPAEESKNCVTNKASGDHWEHPEPISTLTPIDEKGVNLDGSEMNCQECFVSSPLEINARNIIEQELSCGNSPGKDQSSYMGIHARTFLNNEEISGKMSKTSGVQVPDTTVANDIDSMELDRGDELQLFVDTANADLPCKQDDFITDSEQHHGSSQKPNMFFNTHDHSVSMEDPICDEKKLSMSFIPRNDSASSNYMEDELSMAKEKQDSSTITERKSFTKNETCDTDETLPTLKFHQPPERLLSTRKVISPSSHEQRCLASNSTNLHDDIEPYRSEEKLCFETSAENKASLVESDGKPPEMTENHGSPVQVSQEKVILNSRQIFKKSKNIKSILYKGNLEGPRCSRTPPKFSKVCTTKSCSESAITFSQEQMHDTESLAVKLLNELKCMKDVVEEKLLFGAYRSSSLKNDVDKVRSVVKSATKVEDTAKKWLSMMARDCHRFCKIMKLTQNRVPVCKSGVLGKWKKIVFADETGGELCHVKFYESNVTCQVADAEKQEGQDIVPEQ